MSGLSYSDIFAVNVDANLTLQISMLIAEIFLQVANTLENFMVFMRLNYKAWKRLMYFARAPGRSVIDLLIDVRCVA
jgi:hypothetical protein